MPDPELGVWEVVWDGPPKGMDHCITAHCPNCGRICQFRWRVKRETEFRIEHPHMEVAASCFQCGAWFALPAKTLFIFDRRLCEMSYEGVTADVEYAIAMSRPTVPH